MTRALPRVTPLWVFRHLLAHPLAAIRIAWPLMIVAFVYAGAEAAQQAVFKTVFTTDPQASDVLLVNGLAAISAVAVVAFYILLAVTAIRWHRFVLSDEAPDARPSWPGWPRFRTYALRGIAIALMVSLPIIALVYAGIMFFNAYLTETYLGHGDPFGIVALALYLPAYWIVLRLSLVLPAAALDTPLGFGQSWRLTAPVATSLWGGGDHAFAGRYDLGLGDGSLLALGGHSGGRGCPDAHHGGHGAL